MDFATAYQSYSQDVHRFALYLTGNQAAAEDLTSETFVRAFTSCVDVRAATVKAYLFAIARNLYRDGFVYAQRTAPSTSVVEPLDPSPLADAAASGRQRLSTVLRAIQQLPPSEREALILSVHGELPYEQIGAILNCSVAAVKVRIHRARLKLKSELEKEESSCKL